MSATKSSLSANAQYTIGMMVSMSAYVGLLYLAITTIQNNHPTGALLYALAIGPSLPIGASILVFMNYIQKVDEYLRSLLTRRFITTTGITLFLCTAWGFLENFAGAHHFSLYLVYPLFWGCYGVMQILIRQS